MSQKPIRIDTSTETFSVIVRYADGSNSVTPSKIVNERGLRRVLKRHAKFYGMSVSEDGLSAA